MSQGRDLPIVAVTCPCCGTAWLRVRYAADGKRFASLSLHRLTIGHDAKGSLLLRGVCSNPTCRKRHELKDPDQFLIEAHDKF